MLSLLQSRFCQGSLQKSWAWDPRRVFLGDNGKKNKTLLFKQKSRRDLFDDGRPGKGAGEGEGQKNTCGVNALVNFENASTAYVD